MDFQPNNYTNIFLGIFPWDFAVCDPPLGNGTPRHTLKVYVLISHVTLVLPLLTT